jgi:hypothetical protein
MFDVEVICAWIFHRASAPVQPHSYEEVRWKWGMSHIALRCVSVMTFGRQIRQWYDLQTMRQGLKESFVAREQADVLIDWEQWWRGMDETIFRESSGEAADPAKRVSALKPRQGIISDLQGSINVDLTNMLL